MFLFSVKFFLHLLCISLVPMIFPYPAQILLENALLCRRNARLKNRSLCSKFCRQNLSKPIPDLRTAGCTSCMLSLTWQRLQVFASISDWFTELCGSVVDECDSLI